MTRSPCQYCLDPHVGREPGSHQRVGSLHSPDVGAHRTAPCSTAMQVATPRQLHAAVSYFGPMTEDGKQGQLENAP